jgi:uncharacterized membrane protein
MSRVTHDEPPEGADQSGRPAANGSGPLPAAHEDSLTARLARIEALLTPARGELAMAERTAHTAEQRLTPAWRRVTRGEVRWASTTSVVVVMVIQLFLPDRVAVHPHLLMPAIELALLLCLFALNPYRIERSSHVYRALSLALTLSIGGANMYSAFRLASGLVESTEKAPAGSLLLTGGAIWLINMVIFGLGYWELDRGGPAARAQAKTDVADFLFVQMQSPELAPAHWEPAFFDYFYLSFTNSTAFSPTDVMPATWRAKALMLGQSAVSLIIVVLVVARAVNTLK